MPDEVLLASLEETPRAVRLLGGLVDYCVAIDNDVGGEPHLLGGCGREEGREGGREESDEKRKQQIVPSSRSQK